jgi:hypothetical protein
MISVMKLDAYTFVNDAIQAYRREHGVSPVRLEVSPESHKEICATVYPSHMVELGPDSMKIMGVPVVVIKGCPPRLFGHDGKLHLL